MFTRLSIHTPSNCCTSVLQNSLGLAKWLIEEYGIATLPGSAFGEDDAGLPGGRYRLRMATSYLYFRDDSDRYMHGYDLLEGNAAFRANARLPLLDEAIDALQKSNK